MAPQNANQRAALAQLYTTDGERATAAGARLAFSRGAISLPVWLGLGLAALGLIVFILRLSNGSEYFGAQATRVGAVIDGVTAGLLIILALNVPFGTRPGDIPPEAIQDAVAIIRTEQGSHPLPLPCDAKGYPRLRRRLRGRRVRQLWRAIARARCSFSETALCDSLHEKRKRRAPDRSLTN